MKKLSGGLTVAILVQLILGLSALCAGAAEDSERNWTMYMRGRDGTEYYYDKQAVLETPQRYLQVWRKRVFKKGAAQKEIITFDQLACDFREEFRTLQMTVTYWDGTSKVYSNFTQWAHIYTNSPEQYLVDEHCKGTYKVVPEK